MLGLIGRDDEFAAIGAALRRPDLAGVLLAGDAGVGKSHLLGATMRHAEDTGFATVQVTGTTALADIPLAAFSALLPGRPMGDAGDLVLLRRTMQERAGGRPLLLGVDDAHLLDEASAALVHQLASDLTAFVVGTIRAGETMPDAIAALMKDGLIQRLSIEPLQRAAMAGLAEHTLGQRISSAAEEQLWKRTLGNPLFARELLLGAVESGALVTKEDRLELTGEFSAPRTLTELVEGRLAGLGDADQRAVALIGVGGPLEIDLLERLVDPDALVHLEEARVLAADEVEGTLVVRFVHPAYAEVARQRVGRLLARQLLRELADGLEGLRQQRPDDLLRIATWRLDSGAGADPALVLRAARMATDRNDFALAERLGVYALEMAPSMRAAVFVTNSYVEQARFDEARLVLGDERLDRASGKPSDRVRAAWLETTIDFWGFGDRASALDVLDRCVLIDPDMAPFFDSVRGVVESSAGFADSAISAVPHGSAAAKLPLGVYTTVTAMMLLGRPQHGLDLVGPMPEFPGVAGVSLVEAAYAQTLVEAGRITEARDAAIEGWERALRESDSHGRVAWSITMGWVDLTMGRRASAQRWFAEATELARNTPAATYGTRWGLGGVVLCATQAGDLATARDAQARIDQLAPHEAVICAYFGMRGRAWLRAAEGDIDGAAGILRELADEAWEHRRIAPWVRIVNDLARLGRVTAAMDLLDAHPVEVDGLYLPSLIRGVQAMSARDAPALMENAERMTEFGALALGSEAAAAAWAIAREEHLDGRLVAQFGRRAQEMRESIDATMTLGFTTGPPEVSLSRREREIALLVAGGKTSREVADELIIGIRTVESHLARVYSKLGVRSRTELADALGLIGVT